ncbi:hypothetical protein ACOSP7_016638 [Xanthoceras sorbifolium]
MPTLKQQRSRWDEMPTPGVTSAEAIDRPEQYNLFRWEEEEEVEERNRPLTDNELDPPACYVPIRTPMRKLLFDNRGQMFDVPKEAPDWLPFMKPKDYQFFGALLNMDHGYEVKMSPEHQRERKIMKLLLKVKNNTRHLLVKVIDKVLYKLDDLVRLPYVYKILVVVEPQLIDKDYYAQTVQQISILIGCAVGLIDENHKVRTITALSLAALVEAIARMTPDDEMRKIMLKVVKQYVRRTTLDRRNCKQLVKTTMDMADKVSVAAIEELLVDGIMYAFQEQTSDDAYAIMPNGFAAVVNALGQRQLLGHLGVVLYKYLGEEYPEVLESILGALKTIVNVIDLLPRLSPILKNRHNKVQENCITLIAHKKSIQQATFNTFGYRAKASGPQDVLATIFNNLRVCLLPMSRLGLDKKLSNHVFCDAMMVNYF